ncbi:hypothetical protein [Companilactobacillus futsaii]|uniref:hypothetical protein n=1 Tax=Companilactobacillus futsaii TaxID=938155 RepID=UPI00189C5A01|nr:hypothetical protein [Companilactobacillus futsaii]
MDIKELNFANQDLDNFAGLSHIGNGKNQDIEKYYLSFRTWLDWNNVLDVVNNYKNIKMDLHYVTSYDFFSFGYFTMETFMIIFCVTV